MGCLVTGLRIVGLAWDDDAAAAAAAAGGGGGLRGCRAQQTAAAVVELPQTRWLAVARAEPPLPRAHRVPLYCGYELVCEVEMAAAEGSAALWEARRPALLCGDDDAGE